MDTVETTKTKKKGTTKTETIIGTGVNKLEQANKAITDALKQFDTLPKMLGDLAAQIADKQSKLEQLTVEFTEKKRQLEVDLKL